MVYLVYLPGKNVFEELKRSELYATYPKRRELPDNFSKKISKPTTFVDTVGYVFVDS